VSDLPCVQFKVNGNVTPIQVYKMRWFLNLRRIDSGQAGSFIGKIIVPNIYYVIAIQKVAGKI